MKKSNETWPDIQGRVAPNYFATMIGQSWITSNYPGVEFPDRPIAWALPGELGPWPDDSGGVVLRILSLLPGVSASIVGDFLNGTWTKRSDSHRLLGQIPLFHLKDKGLVRMVHGKKWDEWYAVTPVANKIDPTKPQVSTTRAFYDRFRLAAADSQMHVRLEARRDRDLAHLRKLELVEPAKRDHEWLKEFSIYQEIAAAWQKSGPIPTGN